jgi:hypothetical protein
MIKSDYSKLAQFYISHSYHNKIFYGDPKMDYQSVQFDYRFIVGYFFEKVSLILGI